MSNPVRQMNHRRLPPLPGAAKHGATSKTPKGSAKKLQHKGEPTTASTYVSIDIT